MQSLSLGTPGNVSLAKAQQLAWLGFLSFRLHLHCSLGLQDAAAEGGIRAENMCPCILEILTAREDEIGYTETRIRSYKKDRLKSTREK